MDYGVIGKCAHTMALEIVFQGRVVISPSPLPSPILGEGVRAAQQLDFKNKDHEFIMVL